MGQKPAPAPGGEGKIIIGQKVMKFKKYLWIALAVILALIALRFWLNSRKKETSGGPGGRPGTQAVAVEIGAVEVGDLDETASFSGTLTAKNSFILASKTSGQLLKLHVNIGDTVAKGQLVAELDDRIIRQEYEKSRAAVEVARANLDQAASALALSEKSLADNRQLLANNYISQTEFDRANNQYVSDRAKHNVAQASLNSALAAFSAAETQLSFTRVKADWSGGGTHRVIGERLADEGALLNPGSPIVTVLDINSLVAVVEVIERDYQRVRPGQAAKITTDAFAGESFGGRVARIAPLLQENSRQARVEIEVANPSQRLKPGMFARVELLYRSLRGVTSVPAAALFKLKGDEGVFLLNRAERTVSFVPVEKGIATLGRVEIVSPALEGEVVTLGQDQLQDGRKVLLPEDEKQKEPKGKKGQKG